MKKVNRKEIIKNRTPQTDLPVMSPIDKRFSPRVYTPSQISQKEIRTIFEAARLAPSARNLQPWKFWYALNGTDSYDKLLESMPERNHWCKESAMLVLGACGRSCEYVENDWAEYDLGAACMSLVLQSHQLGYHCRQIGLFDEEKLQKSFNIADEFDPFIIIAVGKIGTQKNYQEAPAEFVELEQRGWDRKDLDDVVSELTIGN